MDFFLIFCDVCYKSFPETKNQLKYLLTSCKNILCHNCHLSSKSICPKCHQERCRRIMITNELKESIRVYFNTDGKHSIDIGPKIYQFQKMRFKRFEHFLLKKYEHYYSQVNESTIQLQAIEKNKIDRITQLKQMIAHHEQLCRKIIHPKQPQPVEVREKQFKGPIVFKTPQNIPHRRRRMERPSVVNSQFDHHDNIYCNSTPLPGHEYYIDGNIFFDNKPPSSIFSGTTARSNRYRFGKH